MKPGKRSTVATTKKSTSTARTTLKNATTTKPLSGLSTDQAIIIDCPVPPSQNRLWRYGKGHVYKSAVYEQWAWEFFIAWLDAGRPTIEGPFEAEILICPKRKRDCDNNAKAILDTCQKLGVIRNDADAIRVVQELVDKRRAPAGCRLRITPLARP